MGLDEMGYGVRRWYEVVGGGIGWYQVVGGGIGWDWMRWDTVGRGGVGWDGIWWYEMLCYAMV